jgi:hypothetical protein
VRTSIFEVSESFVNLEVGIPHGRSLSGWISYDQHLEGTRITRRQGRLIARREYSQISQIASRVFTELEGQIKRVCILDISSRGISVFC